MGGRGAHRALRERTIPRLQVVASDPVSLLLASEERRTANLPIMRPNEPPIPLPGDFPKKFSAVLEARSIQSERRAAAELKDSVGSSHYSQCVALRRLSDELAQVKDGQGARAIIAAIAAFNPDIDFSEPRASTMAYVRLSVAAAAGQFAEPPPEALQVLGMKDKRLLGCPILVDLVRFFAHPEEAQVTMIVEQLEELGDKEKRVAFEALRRAVAMRELFLFEGEKLRRELEVITSLLSHFSREHHRAALVASDLNQLVAILTRQLGRTEREKSALCITIATLKLFYAGAHTSIALPFVSRAIAHFPRTQFVAEGWLEECPVCENFSEVDLKLVVIAGDPHRRTDLEALHRTVKRGTSTEKEEILLSVLRFLVLQSRFVAATSFEPYGAEFVAELKHLIAELIINDPELGTMPFGQKSNHRIRDL